MSTIRPLATVAVLAAVGLFLVMKINEGGNGALDTGFGLEPVEIAQASGDADSEAPPFYSEPQLSAGEPADEAPLAPPVFTDAPAEPAAPLFTPESDTPADAAGELPPLPELPPIDAAEGQPLPDEAATPGAVMAGPAALLESGGTAESLPPPENVPTARYPDQASAEPGAAPPATTPAAVSESSLPASPYGVQQPAATDAASSPPQYESYPTSETTPLTFDSPADNSDADWQAAQAALARGDLVAAHQLLSSLRESEGVSTDRRREIDRLVGGLAGTLIYDSREHRLAPPHHVQQGETLQTIATKYQVPWRLLAKINGVATPESIRPGQTLKVVQGPFSAVVDEQAGEVVLKLGETYAGRFSASINLPPGSAEQLRVESKRVGPTPSLVLSGGASPITVGAAAGRYESAGVSLSSADAAEIADILSVGSLVTIRR